MNEQKNIAADAQSPAEKSYNLLKRVRIYISLTLLLTLLAAAAQTFVLKYAYDMEMGVYRAGDLRGPIVAWLLFAFALLLIGAGFAIKKKTDLTSFEVGVCGAPEAFFSAMGGGLVLAFSVMSFLNAGDSKPLKIVSVLLVIFAIPTSAYMILSAITKRADNYLLMICGFFPVIWLAICLLRVYFERTSAINDPIKILFQISISAIMLYYLMELRARIGKSHMGGYLAMASLAALLGTSASASILIAYLLGVNGFRDDLMLAITEMILSFYILTRLIAFRSGKTLVDGEK